jgi:hypothetical protein
MFKKLLKTTFLLLLVGIFSKFQGVLIPYDKASTFTFC